MRLSKVDPVQVLGKCSSVSITKKRTVMVGGHGQIKRRGEEVSSLEARVMMLEDYLHDNPLVGDMQRDELSERISKLKGGLILIQPGGRTELEVSECRDRIEDAVCALQAALKHGFVVGGGAALIHASKILKTFAEDPSRTADWRFGVKVAAHACTAPCRRILNNVESYPDAEILIERIKSGSSSHGIDVRNFDKNATGDLSIIDLVDRGIIDPLLVVKNAMLYGSSIASVLLSAECAVV